jgi:hypothetical protein
MAGGLTSPHYPEIFRLLQPLSGYGFLGDRPLPLPSRIRVDLRSFALELFRTNPRLSEPTEANPDYEIGTRARTSPFLPLRTCRVAQRRRITFHVLRIMFPFAPFAALARGQIGICHSTPDSSRPPLPNLDLSGPTGTYRELSGPKRTFPPRPALSDVIPWRFSSECTRPKASKSD